MHEPSVRRAGGEGPHRRWMTPAATRAFLVLGLVAGLVGAWPTQARADTVWPQAGCQPFSHVQTYPGWGPARFYGRPVTVAYQGTGCSTAAGELVALTLDGTATVFGGSQPSGRALDSRPFSVSGSWQTSSFSSSWTPGWWQCDVPAADYRWTISGVYSFEVSARDGVWTLDVVAGGQQPQSVHWIHNACE